MKTDDEPKGFCPFCDVTGWRICDHFVGYVQGDHVKTVIENKYGRQAQSVRPKLASEVAVNTGVSVRAYRK